MKNATLVFVSEARISEKSVVPFFSLHQLAAFRKKKQENNFHEDFSKFIFMPLQDIANDGSLQQPFVFFNICKLCIVTLIF